MDEIAEFVDHNELGIALESMAYVLSELASPISEDERGEMLSLADLMRMDDEVANLLATVPSRE